MVVVAVVAGGGRGGGRREEGGGGRGGAATKTKNPQHNVGNDLEETMLKIILEKRGTFSQQFHAVKRLS